MMRLPILSRALSIVSAAIAISTGIVVTLGFFVNFAELANLRLIFLEWAVLLAAMALLVGLVNLLRVHLNKVRDGGATAFYSFVLVVGMIATFGLGMFFGPDHPIPLWIFNNIQIPVETALMAILAVSLAYASARLLHRRATVFAVVFLVTTLFVLLGTGSYPWGEITLLVELKSWISRVPATAGARGILLGVALGTIATGLRVLMGVDRPYGG